MRSLRPLHLILTALLLSSSLAAAQGSPVVTISPASGTFTSSTLDVAITWHDDYGLKSGSETILLNGMDVTDQFSTWLTGPRDATSTGTIELSPGQNELTAGIYNIGDDYSEQSAFLTYGVSYGVTVSPHSTSTSQSGSYTFLITNIGTSSSTFLLSARCTGALNGCGVSPDSLILAGGAQRQVSLAYSGGGGASGVAQLVVVQSGNSAIGDSGAVTVNIPKSYGVYVTPDGGSTSVGANLNATYPFTVHNTGNLGARYSLSAGCSGAVFNCTLPDTSIFVSAGGSVQVGVGVHAGSSGLTGKLSIRATQRGHTATTDSGWVSASMVAAGGVLAPIVTTSSVNPGTLQERSQCLRVALPGDAAAECGDLRLVHALPTTRTMNKARTPLLVYSSQQAHPNPGVFADVTLPSSGRTPDGVSATMTVGGVTSPAKAFTASAWTPGATRRIYVALPQSTSYSTGVYSYTLR